MRITFLVLAIAAAGCSNVNPSSPTAAFLDKAKLTDFAISGSTTFLSLNQKSQLAAKIRSPQGLATVTDRVTWESADQSIATVSSAGLLTSVGFGSTNVTARLNDQEVTQRVDVLTASSMTIAGTTLFTTLNRTNQLSLVATWPGGTTRTVTNDATWSSDNPSVVSITSTGAARSASFGSTTIRAKYQSLSVSVNADVVVSFGQLNIQGTLTLGSIGETSALTAIAVMTDNSTKDVTAQTTWSGFDSKVAQISPAGIVTATGFGVTNVQANYDGHSRTFIVTVTPPGTFVARGRVRDPGAGQGEGLGVDGFLIRDTRSGITTTSSTTGYTLAGVLPGDRVTYEKNGWETAEITFVTSNDDPSPAVQEIVRVNVGATAFIGTAPNDLRYDLAAGVFCSPCRRVRVVSAGAANVHLQLSWSGTTSRLSIWAGGKAFTAGSGPATVGADVSLGAGENVIYVGLLNGGPFSTGYLNLTLTTAVSVAEPAARAPIRR